MCSNLEIFISDDGEIYNSIYISCRKDGKQGRIKEISAPWNSGIKEKYEKEVKGYLNSKEADIIVSKIEKCLG